MCLLRKQLPLAEPEPTWNHTQKTCPIRVYRALERLMNFYRVLMKTGIYFNKNHLTKESWKYLAVHRCSFCCYFMCFLVSEENGEEMYEDIYKTKNNDQKPEWVSFVTLGCRLTVFLIYLVSPGLRCGPISHHHPWGKSMWSGDKLLKILHCYQSEFAIIHHKTEDLLLSPLRKMFVFKSEELLLVKKCLRQGK